MESGTERVRALIMTTWPDRFEASRLDDDAELGGGGLGLDSIEVAELAIACEGQSGQDVDDALFDGEPVTLGRFAAHFWPSP